jgi:sulfatase maturation enzyme AslB (radical SAM superfamily)
MSKLNKKRKIVKILEKPEELNRKIENKKENYCPAPYRQLCINPHGELSPCCMINEPGQGFGKLTDDLGTSLAELQQKTKWKKFKSDHENEKMPNLCERACGIHYPSEYHNQWQWAESEGWKQKTNDIKRADIAFSNLCNLSCTMCSASFSSEWIKLMEKIGGPGGPSKPWNFSIDQVKELANEVSSCNVVNIKGGEPFFNPRLKIFLKELADKNLNVHLPILTNGTVIDDEALTQFSRFENRPTFVVSLETTNNDLYQYIRGGKYTFDDVKKNIAYVKKNYPKLLIKTNYILGAWNIDNFRQDMKNLRNAGVEDCNILVIHNPVEQSIKIVNEMARENWVKNFTEDRDKNPNFYKTMINDGWDKMLIDNMRSVIFKPQKHKNRMLVQANKYIRYRRFMQNTNVNFDCITKVVPNYLKNME